jgi:hypothetical protein
MRKTTPREVHRLRELLRARLFKKAVDFAISINPRWSQQKVEERTSEGVSIGFTLDPLPTVPDIAMIFECRPKSLAFCTAREMKQLRVAVALAWLGVDQRELVNDLSKRLAWPHPMRIGAAVHNLIAGCFAEKNAKRWKTNGLVESVKLLTSADGPCEVCRKAAEREYTASETPITPVPGCTNMEDGCRCVMAPTKMKGIDW